MTISPSSPIAHPRPRIPTRKECLDLMEAQAMLPNIRGHSLQVARVAKVLASNLLVANPRLNLSLLEAGALLHDIAKTECLKTQNKHTLVGADFLRARGYPEVAEIVAQHVNLNEEYPQNHQVTEIEIVHYADKRVLHEEIVDLETRFQYLQERYGRSPEDRWRIAALLDSSRKQEKKIFRDLSFAPSELKSRVGHLNDYT